MDVTLTRRESSFPYGGHKHVARFATSSDPLAPRGLFPRVAQLSSPLAANVAQPSGASPMGRNAEPVPPNDVDFLDVIAATPSLLSRACANMGWVIRLRRWRRTITCLWRTGGAHEFDFHLRRCRYCKRECR